MITAPCYPSYILVCEIDWPVRGELSAKHGVICREDKLQVESWKGRRRGGRRTPALPLSAGSAWLMRSGMAALAGSPSAVGTGRHSQAAFLFLM